MMRNEQHCHRILSRSGLFNMTVKALREKEETGERDGKRRV